MANPSLSRIDDILLAGALKLGGAACFLVLSLWGMSTSGTLALTRWQWFGLSLLCIAPVAMAVVGSRIRKAEKQALSLLKLVHQQVEIDAGDLIRFSDWKRQEINRAIRDLNNAGLAFVIWDRKSDKIQDGRLRRESAVVDDCGGCGAKVNFEIAIGDAAAVSCPYCGERLDPGAITEEKARVMGELEAERVGRLAGVGAGVGGGSKFSLPTFMVLMMFFWPAALFYAFRHRQILASGG